MSEDALDTGNFRQALLTRELGRTLHCVEATGSTNDDALAAAAAGAEHGLTVVAEEQTAGRGRGGNRWLAPRGKALLASVLLRPDLPAAAAPRLTFAAAAAVADLLREGGLDAHIKWPNDILVGGRKIAGILCESRARGDRVEAVVIGIGLNVNQELAELPEGATSIRVECAAAADRGLVLAELLNRLEPLVALVAADRFDELRRVWEGLSRLHVGHHVRLTAPDGDVEGTSAGIDEAGALRIRLADGSERRFVSGSAVFAP